MPSTDQLMTSIKPTLTVLVSLVGLLVNTSGHLLQDC